ADGAQSSRVPIPLPDDPYVAVRQARLVDNESEPEEAPSEAAELQSLGYRVSLRGKEFVVVEPSSTRIDSSHSSASLDSSTPLSPNHPLTCTSPTPTPTRALFHHRTTRITVRVQPAMSPSLSASIAKVAATSDSAFRKRFRSRHDSSPPSTFLVRKRNKGTSKLILDTESDEDELGDEDTDEDEEDKSFLERSEEEAVPEGQQQAALVTNAVVGEPLGLRYGALRCRELAVKEDRPTLTTWIDLDDGKTYIDIPTYPPPHVSPAPFVVLSPISSPLISLTVPSPIASPVATLTATISVDEDQFLEVGAQLELHRSILYDHTQCLDAMPTTLFAKISRDMSKLYTRSGAARDEIFF
nr:hypothetical protein [Tanacetum cinerariifolium]